MASSLFLVHWNADEAEEMAAPLRQHGWKVEIEAEDGGRAYRRVRELSPVAVLISLRRLPSHGRETARALLSNARSRSIPLVFIDGQSDKIAALHESIPDGIFTTSEDLLSALNELLEAPAGG